MKHTLALGAAIGALALGGAASAATFPGYGNDTSGPGITITVNANNSISITSSGQGPYDGADDSYIGVINNSGHSIGGLNLSSTQCIGCFDGDGIDTYGAPGNASDTTGYGGPASFFTNNLGNSLTVKFLGGLAGGGGSTYFSLEEPITAGSLTSVPEPATWALMLVGFAGLGAAVRGRKTKLA